MTTRKVDMKTPVMSLRRGWARLAAVAVLALIAAGLPTSAHADAATSISGRLVLPTGADAGDFYAATYSYSAGDQMWEINKLVTPDPDGTFVIDTLNPSREYRLGIFSQIDDYVGGAYAGRGVPLISALADAPAVFAGSSGFELAPVKSVSMTGTFSVPAGFDWSVGDLVIDASEVGLEASVFGHTPRTWVDQGSAGAFTLDGLRPGGQYVLRSGDFSGARFGRGYYHAGVAGLVEERDHATPVAQDRNVHITIGYTLVAPSLSVVDAPEVSGKAVVGETLTATPGTWSMVGVGLAHQWLRNGHVIAGATSSSYTLQPADAGAKIAVHTIASKTTFTNVSITSSPTADVARAAAPRASTAPKVKGKARLGKKLRATSGTWSAAGVQLSYQWLRNGKAIKGANSAKYKLKKKDVRKRVSVRVTASLAGHLDGVAASSSKKVAKAKPKVTLKAKKKIKAGQRAKLVVKVKASGVARPKGTVIVKYGKKT